MARYTKSIQIPIKSSCDNYHDLWTAKPHEVPNLTPTEVQNCLVLEGEVGTVGCVLEWHYFLDGKHCVFKSLTQAIDKEKKSVSYKGLGGDLVELYKSFDVHIQVDTSNNLVIWTVEYEKPDPNVPDPDTLLQLYKRMTKDIETHHLQN